MDGSAVSDKNDKPWDHPWTTDEMREKRADWNLAGDSGLLQHLQQFSNKLVTTANKTQEALNSLTSELDETIIFIDNITNTSLALANTQFIESRVCEDDIETEVEQEKQLEIPKTKEQLDAELIASIGESVRRGIAIMEDKYETLEVVASDSEDEGEISIPSVILRPKDPYQDRPLPYIIGSEKWKNSSKLGLESSSSESEHQEDDESDSDSEDNIAPVSKPINLQNPRIARFSSSSSSQSNDYNEANNGTRNEEDSASNKNQDIFYSESEITTAANSVPKNSSNAAPNFAEELAKRLGSVIPTQKSMNTQSMGEPAVIKPKDDLFTPEDDDLFATPSKNLFDEPAGLFDEEESSNSLWNDKPAKSLKSNVIPPSLDVPPPINDVSTKQKSAFDDLFGDADSEDSDDIFSGKTSTRKSANDNNSPGSNVRSEDNKRNKNLLSVGGLTTKEGMTTSTPEINDANNKSNSLFDDESEDDENLFNKEKNLDDWTGAKASILDNTAAGSIPAEASDTNSRKKPVGGVSILGEIDIFSSGKFRRQVSSDSVSSKSSSDFDTSKNKLPNTNDGDNSVRNNNNSADGNSLLGVQNMENTGSSGISVQPQSMDDVTTGSNISPGFQPQMTSTWNKTGDMYRERIGSDSLFAAKTLDRDNENSLNNARIDEVPDVQNSDSFEETNDIFGPPPLPKSGSKTGTKSKVASLFDDSDSGDDIFLDVSSESRSQKSADLLPTTTSSIATSQSSEKSKILRKKGLFDDDDDDDNNGRDIFGTKDSSDVDIFATKTSGKKKQSEIVREISDSLIKAEKSTEVSSTVKEGLESSFEKQNTVKIPQTAPVTKLGSIFDDLDDDDLFSPSFTKKTSAGRKATAPSLFDDGADDLFAVPSKTAVKKEEQTVESSSLRKSKDFSESVEVKSSTKIGGEMKSKMMEQLASKLEVVKTEEKVDVESKSKNASTVLKKDVKTAKNIDENIAASNSEKNDNFSKNKSKLLASKILDEIKTVQKSKVDVEAKPGIAKKPEVLKKLHRKMETVSKPDLSKDVASLNATEISSESVEETEVVSEVSSVKSIGSEKGVSASSRRDRSSSKISKSENFSTDQELSSESSKSEESPTGVRREPPKTLEIRSSTTSVSSEKSSSVQRRVVSGKIKNLMGCMSDLKILSPTDTPPVWRKNEERVDEEGDKDSEDGSSFSTSKDSPTFSEELPKIVAPPPPIDRKELEPAISFDQPVQVETLSVTASKSRVRIQSKRRPQSRHARQNALRKSGIDFVTDDFSNDNNSDTNRNLSSNSENNNPTSTENSTNAQNIANSNTDRLIIPTGGSESVSVKVTESSSSTFFDDRSEISFSKESSLSVNKNTLLSPSTDEEDLFDVPPDLPEDPLKEDSLFGRAPILSPVESFVEVKKDAKHESYKSEKRKDGVTEKINVSNSESRISINAVTKESSQTDTRDEVFSEEVAIRDKRVVNSDYPDKITSEKKEPVSAEILEGELKSNKSGDEKNNSKNRVVKREEGVEELSDPLHNSTLDPLKDASNLFAFVTKTPSPEKGINTLFNDDDDSLFSSSLSKTKDGKAKEYEKTGKIGSTQKKQTLDLFADDAGVDFFTAALPKSARKSKKESKIDLFGTADDNQDEDLFGGNRKKSIIKSDVKSSEIVTTEKTINEIESLSSSKKNALFHDSSEEKLFGISKTKTEAKKKSEYKKAASSSSGIFSDDDNSGIFTGTTVKPKSTEFNSGTKKIVNDIFGDQSSGEEDMFASKKTVIKKSTVSSGLFDDDDDDGAGDIFGKSTSSTVIKKKSIENRGAIKRAATRDLRKTAEQIVEDDPLSILQRD